MFLTVLFLIPHPVFEEGEQQSEGEQIASLDHSHCLHREPQTLPAPFTENVLSPPYVLGTSVGYKCVDLFLELMFYSIGPWVSFWE